MEEYDYYKKMMAMDECKRCRNALMFGDSKERHNATGIT